MDKRGPGIITPKSTLGSYNIIKVYTNLTQGSQKFSGGYFLVKDSHRSLFIQYPD